MTQRVYLLLVVSIFVGGCAESNAGRADRLEPMLAQAGFRMIPANTPAQSQKLGDMTPLQINYQSHKGKLSYWFADPYVCRCLYVGDKENFDQFERLKQTDQDERAQDVTDMAEQTRYEEYMNSPAGGMFYGQ